MQGGIKLGGESTAVRETCGKSDRPGKQKRGLDHRFGTVFGDEPGGFSLSETRKNLDIFSILYYLCKVKKK